MDSHDAMARNVLRPTDRSDDPNAQEAERHRQAIRQHDTTIQTLERNLTEVRRLRDQKAERLAYL
jgi:hypothetical protein